MFLFFFVVALRTNAQMDALDKFVFGKETHKAFDIALRIENYTGTATNKLTRHSSSSGVVSNPPFLFVRYYLWYRGRVIPCMFLIDCCTCKLFFFQPVSLVCPGCVTYTSKYKYKPIC